MNGEDKKVDQLIKDLMADVGLNSPPSGDYTRQVMLKASQIQAEKSSSPGIRYKAKLILIGIALYITGGLAIYLLSQSSLFDLLLIKGEDMITHITSFVSYKSLMLGLIGIILHLLVIRFIFLVYFLKNERVFIRIF